MSLDSNHDLGQALRQLTVTAPALDRDRLLFEAGRRSVKRTWTWPLATVASLLLACASGLLYWQQPMKVVQEAQTPVPELLTTQDAPKAVPERIEAISPFSYLALREASFSTQPRAVASYSQETKPMPILSAGSYVLPEWQRW